MSDQPQIAARLSLMERIWAKPITRHSPRALFEMICTSRGRRRLPGGLRFLLWPLTSRLAALYRRTLVRRARIIAIGGSLGKSTTAHAVAIALGLPVQRRLRSNALPMIPFLVLRLLPWVRQTVVETGIDGPRQMEPMARTLRPDIAVITSIASEHNRSLGTLGMARHEKAFLVRALSSSGVAVLNGDDPNVASMAGETRAKIVTFGFGEGNNIRATDAQLEWPRGMRFCLHAAGCQRDVSIGLFGRHMIYPALAAVAVALERSVPLDTALSRLTAISPIPGRMVVRQLANGATLICDERKSSLETIHAALDLLEQVPAARKIVVLGPIAEPPGPAGPFYRELGQRIARVAELAVFVNSFQEYKGGVYRGGMKREAMADAAAGYQQAVDYLRLNLHEGDVVLIKGRDSQKLDRIALALEGRQVRCMLTSCRMRGLTCGDCPDLERNPRV